MTYDELIILYPLIDLFLELFKGLAPMIVAILAIVVNQYNLSISGLEQINDTNKLVGDVMDVCTQYSYIFKCENVDERIKLLDEASEKLKNSTKKAKNQALRAMSDIAKEIKRLTEEG